MIKISLDEAYVFDMLSILDVKLKKLSDDKLEIAKIKYEKLIEEIIEHIGKDMFENILLSKEYSEMVKANENLFDFIDESKLVNDLSKKTDDLNYTRYLKKIELQEKFFNNKLTEVKNRN